MDKAYTEAAKEKEPWESAGFFSHFFWFLLLVLFASFIFWAHTSLLDVVSVAPGEVVPISKVQQVQHLEGGIIREILVQEGDTVQANQPLVVLDSISSGSDLASMRMNIRTLRINLQRLQAEASGKEGWTFTSEISDLEDPNSVENTETTKKNGRHAAAPIPAISSDARSMADEDTAKIIQQATAMFKTRRRALLSRQKAKKEELTQRKQELVEIKARLQNQKRRLKLLREQVSISKKMLATETTSRYEHLNLLKEANELRSRIEEDQAAFKRSQAAISQSEEGLASVWNNYATEVQTELNETQNTLNDLQLRVGKLEDNMQRTTLRSPIMGVVKTLYAVSQGGVIAPGGTVLDIVPGGDQLIVEAHLPAQDVGHVHIGQAVIIRLASAEAARFGKLPGTVNHISPDTLVNQEGTPYYIVRITTEQSYFQKGADRYSLVPGVVVSAGILTGQHTVLDYFLDPFMHGMTFALSER